MGGEAPLSQPTRDVAQSNKIPIATPRFGNSQSRNVTGHNSQRHSKSVPFADKPKRRSPAIPPNANETPSSFDGYASGSVELSFPLESERHLSQSDILTVTLVCSGLRTPVFFSKATTHTTESNQFHRLPFKVKNIVESKSDLTDVGPTPNCLYLPSDGAPLSPALGPNGGIYRQDGLLLEKSALRRYLEDCAKHCTKLNELLCNDSDGKWTEDHALAWDSLKHGVSTTKGL